VIMFSSVQFQPSFVASQENNDNTANNNSGFEQNLISWERMHTSGEERSCAAQRIRHCIGKQEAALNLSGLNLSSLPEGLADAIKSTVKLIDISNNKISDRSQFKTFLKPGSGFSFVYQNNPACTFNNNNYELKVIPENTPIVFQWHVMNKNKFEGEKYPIINTNQSPYLDNILNTCKIESGRTIGLFISGDISGKHKAALNELQERYENLKVIYPDALDKKDFFTKNQVDCLKDSISFYQKTGWHQDKICYMQNDLKKVEAVSPHATMFDKFSSCGGRNEMDFYRQLLVFNGGRPFSGVDDGLIYMDCDMLIKEPLGDVITPDGISVYNKYGAIENGIIAVDRPRHPALREGITLMENNWTRNDIYYDGFCGGIREHFNAHENYSGISTFIEFPVNSMLPDTSAATGKSTWSTW